MKTLAGAGLQANPRGGWTAAEPHKCAEAQPSSEERAASAKCADAHSDGQEAADGNRKEPQPSSAEKVMNSVWEAFESRDLALVAATIEHARATGLIEAGFFEEAGLMKLTQAKNGKGQARWSGPWVDNGIIDSDCSGSEDDELNKDEAESSCAAKEAHAKADAETASTTISICEGKMKMKEGCLADSKVGAGWLGSIGDINPGSKKPRGKKGGRGRGPHSPNG